MVVSKAITTRLLANVARGEIAAVEELTPLLYDELLLIARKMLRRREGGHTLQATVLVHEAYMRLVDQECADGMSRAHFTGLAATMMRRVVIDHARAKRRLKRGGVDGHVTLHETQVIGDCGAVDVIALDDVLKKLERLDARQARIVEMRFYGGATVEETAAVLEVSKRCVEDEWRMAKAWLKRELGAG
jgi:RNA polymerase sigma factor (TIGR02999 family)